MKTTVKRMAALCLALIMLLSCVCTAFAAVVNKGVRHQVCTALSSKAKSYYSGKYTYENLSQLEGEDSGSCVAAVNSPMFKALHDLMDDTMTKSVSYSDLVDYWPDTDANNGSYDAVLFYSDKVSSSYNREHVWPKSRASFLKQNGGCDLHHLRPTNSNVNSTRNNYTMGNVRGVISSYSTCENGGKNVLYYSSSYTNNGRREGLVEVNDNIKGDVARILLYVYVRWEEPNLFEYITNPKQDSSDNENNGYPVIESLDTLLQWMEIDPVDTWEMCRNDSIQGVQGNRNVFIDYPEFAWLLFEEELPEDMKTPSGEAADATSFNITVKANNDSYGQVSLDGRTVTATPNTGYEVSGYTLSPENAANVEQNGNVFTLSKMQSDCTFTVNFSARTLAEVRFHAPETISYAFKSGPYYIGDTIQLAEFVYPDCCVENYGHPEGYEFEGWCRNDIAETTVKPVAYAEGASYTLTVAENDFYALYSRVKNGVTYYTTKICEHENTTTVRIEPTCIKAGAIQTVCADCGAVITSTPIDPLGHDYEETVIAPTCEDMGYTLYTCTVCGSDYRRSFTDPTGHNFVDGVCTLCGKQDQEQPPVDDDDEEEKPPVVEPETPAYEDFADLENTWYKDGITYALENGLMNGVAEGKFDPNGKVTRGMLVTILYRVEAQPTVAGLKNPFTDVAAGQWYTDAIIWAADAGIVKGTSATTFEPNTTITREQIATILYRYDGEKAAEADLSDYPDAGEVSAYAVEAMQWAVKMGHINGMDGKLAPTSAATRAQIATILCRYLES